MFFLLLSDTQQSPGSLPVATIVGTTPKRPADKLPPGPSSLSTFSSEQANPVLGSSVVQRLLDGDTTINAIATFFRPEQLVSSFELKPATDSDILGEIDANEKLPVKSRLTESIVFIKEEMGTSHRILGGVLPTFKAGPGFTTLEQADRLQELTKEHMDFFVRDRFQRHGFDPDRLPS